MDVVEKGYLLNDKVIRFAKVVVGSWFTILKLFSLTVIECQPKEITTKY
jgi:hypothetical protein